MSALPKMLLLYLLGFTACVAQSPEHKKPHASDTQTVPLVDPQTGEVRAYVEAPKRIDPSLINPGNEFSQVDPLRENSQR